MCSGSSWWSVPFSMTWILPSTVIFVVVARLIPVAPECLCVMLPNHLKWTNPGRGSCDDHRRVSGPKIFLRTGRMRGMLTARC